jgi:hypothetical protein
MYKPKIIINLYGGPCAGKSVAAARLYSHLSANSLNVELVREYIKDWIYEGIEPTPDDAVSIFGGQLRAETRALSSNDIIITDCPLAIPVYYAREYREALTHVWHKRRERNKQQGIAELDIWVTRGDYDFKENGRFHNEVQSLEIDGEMSDFLYRELDMYISEESTAENIVHGIESRVSREIVDSMIAYKYGHEHSCAPSIKRRIEAARRFSYIHTHTILLASRACVHVSEEAVTGVFLEVINSKYDLEK